MEGVSRELYEKIRAEVIAELEEERRAKARENMRMNKEAMRMYDDLRNKYMPLLVARFSDLIMAERKFEHFTDNVRQSLHERNERTIYKNGKAEEAKKLLNELLSSYMGI